MRDWSTLRHREWQPCSSKDGTGVGAEGSRAADAGGRVRAGNDGQAAGSGARAGATASGRSWRTDAEISGSRADRQSGLQRWDDGDLAQSHYGTLEELSGSHKGGQWNQFKANEVLFGVVSTFKSDLSQYTTPLDPKRVPPDVRRRAEQIAQELDRSNGYVESKRDDLGSDGEDNGMDEEDRYSAVPRSVGYQRTPKCNVKDSVAAEAGGGDHHAGGTLLATLRAGAGPVPGDTDYRSLVAPKVQGWWRARSSAGAPVPPGAEDSLICPFSHHVFGDVSQLVMHWAAALPRADDETGEPASPSSAVTEQFRCLGRQLRWSELAASTGLGSKLSVEAPRPGSVWAQVLMRLEKSSSSRDQPVTERLVGDFVNEAVLMKCWRREQKVEHREVLEGIAAGLALHALDVTGGVAWHPKH